MSDSGTCRQYARGKLWPPKDNKIRIAAKSQQIYKDIVSGGKMRAQHRVVGSDCWQS